MRRTETAAGVPAFAGSQPMSTGSAPPVLGGLERFRRPRLRPDVPVLWRDQSSIQIGDDVVVDRIGRAHVSWLASLDGLATVTDILDTLTIPEGEAARLVRAALAAGALDDAGRIPAAHRWLRASDRDPALATFGALMATHRDLDVATNIVEARDRVRFAVLGTGNVARAVAKALDVAALAVDANRPHLVVLADAPHPDVPALVDHLGLDRPHLHVGVYGSRAVVGPLVVPGLTSCLRCMQLHRRDADPAWPLVAVQWAQAIAGLRPAPIDPLLASLAATQAVLLARAWVDAPTSPEEWADHAIEIRLPRGDQNRASRPPHPLCGCRWLGG